MTEKKDLSRQTLVVLVFLAILVTLLGTLTIMSEVSKVKVADSSTAVDDNSQAQGTVRLSIAGPPPTDAATGMVTLRIVEPSNT